MAISCKTGPPDLEPSQLAKSGFGIDSERIDARALPVKGSYPAPAALALFLTEVLEGVAGAAKILACKLGDVRGDG